MIFKPYNVVLISNAVYLYCKTNCDGYYKKRVIVAQALQELDCCATADDIWTKLYQTKSKVSFAAVYKILNWLIENGFAEKQERSGGKTLYTLKHYHSI